MIAGLKRELSSILLKILAFEFVDQDDGDECGWEQVDP